MSSASLPCVSRMPWSSMNLIRPFWGNSGSHCQPFLSDSIMSLAMSPTASSMETSGQSAFMSASPECIPDMNWL